MFSGNLHGVLVGVNLTEVPRFAERSQWRIHVTTNPVLVKLEPWQRDAVGDLVNALAELVVAWQETEDVDAVGLA